MAAVPDHHFLVQDRLAVDEAVEVRLVRRPGRHRTVVQLRTPVAEYPDVPPRERPVRRGRRHPVVGAGDDLVPLAGPAVLDPPPALAARVPRPPDLKRL